MVQIQFAGDHFPDLTGRGYWDRRKFVKGAAALAGYGGLLGYGLGSAAAELPLETTKIRLLHAPSICIAPQYLAEEILRLEGFTEVTFVELGAEYPGAADLATGR